MKNELIILSGKLINFVTPVLSNVETELDSKVEGAAKLIVGKIAKYSYYALAVLIAYNGLKYMWAVDEQDAKKVLKSGWRGIVGCAFISLAFTIAAFICGAFSL